MISNDRILANIAAASLLSGAPDSLERLKIFAAQKPSNKRGANEMNVAFKQPAGRRPFARFHRRGAVAADRHRRRLRAHRAVRAGRRRPRRADLALPRAGHRSLALSAGDEPPATGEIRLPEELSAFSRLRELPRRRRGGYSRERRALRGRRGLDVRAGRRRSRSEPGRLLSGLSAGGEPRRCARRRTCCSTSPATASAASRRKCSTGCNRSACANMSASASPRQIEDFRGALDEARRGFRRPIGPAATASSRPAIRSSAAAAS